MAMDMKLPKVGAICNHKDAEETGNAQTYCSERKPMKTRLIIFSSKQTLNQNR